MKKVINVLTVAILLWVEILTSITFAESEHWIQLNVSSLNEKITLWSWLNVDKYQKFEIIIGWVNSNEFELNNIFDTRYFELYNGSKFRDNLLIYWWDEYYQWTMLSWPITTTSTSSGAIINFSWTQVYDAYKIVFYTSFKDTEDTKNAFLQDFINNGWYSFLNSSIYENVQDDYLYEVKYQILNLEKTTSDSDNPSNFIVTVNPLWMDLNNWEPISLQVTLSENMLLILSDIEFDNPANIISYEQQNWYIYFSIKDASPVKISYKTMLIWEWYQNYETSANINSYSATSSWSVQSPSIGYWESDVSMNTVVYNWHDINNRIKGAEFSLYDKENNYISWFISDNDGIFKIEDNIELSKEYYLLQENKVEWYNDNYNRYSFTLTKNQNEVNINNNIFPLWYALWIRNRPESAGITLNIDFSWDINKDIITDDQKQNIKFEIYQDCYYSDTYDCLYDTYTYDQFRNWTYNLSDLTSNKYLIKFSYPEISWYDSTYFINNEKEPESIIIEIDDNYTDKKPVNARMEWSKNTFIVKFITNSSWNIIDDKIISKWNLLEKPEEITMDGYKFIWWYEDNDFTQVFDFSSPIQKDITLYAKREKINTNNYSWWWGWSSLKPKEKSQDNWETKDKNEKIEKWDNIQENDAQENNIDNKSNINNSINTSQELESAYEFAKAKWITTASSIENAKMNTSLTRIEMAKMLSQYAINVLWQKPDTSKKVNFKDVSKKKDNQYNNWVTLAYQLWIMWINMPNNKFRPDDLVPRSEFVTALSRMLYNTSDGEYRSTPMYYTHHMEKMIKKWIITNDDPKIKELRWYVMIMLMRSVK